MRSLRDPQGRTISPVHLIKMPTLPKKRQSRSPSRDPSAKSTPKIALALAGGGFLGAAYELGVLAALAESIDGLNLQELSTYIGVSAGGYVAAGLANGMTPHQMIRLFVEAEDSQTPIAPEVMLKPAYDQFGQALKALPKKLKQSIRHLNPLALAPWRFLEDIGAMLPNGFIDSSNTEKTLARIFSEPGRSDKFSSFRGRLRILATDIDSGESVEFGSSGFDQVPISKALTASSAVPGLFVPVEINGRRYLDGAINKTLHASVALEEGAELVICINPLVPYLHQEFGADANLEISRSNLPTILSQTIRTLIRSRMSVGLEKYAVTYPNASVLLFEPSQGNAAVFMTGIFSLKNRRKICQLAYEQTRQGLLKQHSYYEPILKRHGLQLRVTVLNAAATAIVGELPRPRPRKAKTLGAAAIRLQHAIQDLDRKVWAEQIA
jgi:NTE family protein